jgi:hypothetical protein
MQHIKLGLTISLNVKLCKSTSVIGSFNDMSGENGSNVRLAANIAV